MFWQQSLGEDADLVLSPAPIHKHHGGMIQDCYARPAGLYARLCEAVGRPFSLMHYWGPFASPKAGDWIAAASAEVMAKDELACELLLRERRSSATATTALRFPYVLGPRNYADREEFLFNRLLDGEEILLPGDGKAVQQFLSATQAAEAMVTALECFEEGGFRVEVRGACPGSGIDVRELGVRDSGEKGENQDER